MAEEVAIGSNNSNVLFSFPSSGQLTKVFLFNFEQNKFIYDKEMATLSVSSLSCDHTFKISRNAGLVRETDNTFVTQFNQLFISLNEIGQVVAWRLIKFTTFSEIEDLLVDLHKSNSLARNTVDLVCVDDCSRVRNKHTNIFPNVVVKLDLFHACQRVPKTFLRQHSLYKDFVQIKYVAQSTTKGKHAYKRTRPKQKIEKNLNSFIDR